MSDKEQKSEETNEESEGKSTKSSQERRSSSGGSGGGNRRNRRPRPRRRRGRQSKYCPDGRCFDYKDYETLRRFVTETGKIKPRRQTGNCSRCQRQLAKEVKRARHLALLPFVIMTD